MLISKEFKFDAAHNLIDYHGKCENLHGHTYKLRVTLEGLPQKNGMIIDFGIIKSIVNELVIQILDHSYINKLIQQSTAENMILWIWETLSPAFIQYEVRLYELILWETDTSFITYRGQ